MRLVMKKLIFVLMTIAATLAGAHEVIPDFVIDALKEEQKVPDPTHGMFPLTVDVQFGTLQVATDSLAVKSHGSSTPIPVGTFIYPVRLSVTYDNGLSGTRDRYLFQDPFGEWCDFRFMRDESYCGERIKEVIERRKPRPSSTPDFQGKLGPYEFQMGRGRRIIGTGSTGREGEPGYRGWYGERGESGGGAQQSAGPTPTPSEDSLLDPDIMEQGYKLGKAYRLPRDIRGEHLSLNDIRITAEKQADRSGYPDEGQARNSFIEGWIDGYRDGHP
jgi:hypothetical protein